MVATSTLRDGARAAAASSGAFTNEIVLITFTAVGRQGTGDVIRRNDDLQAPVHIPLEYRTANELHAMAEQLRTAADANTHSVQLWTELLTLAAYCDNLADQVED